MTSRGFAAEEYATRCQRMQTAMADAQVDLALFTTPAEFYYFCGFQTPFWHSPTRPWFLLLPASGAPVAVIPGIGAARMRTCHLQDMRTWNSPHPQDEGIALLADAIRQHAGSAPRLGMMRGRQSIARMPPADVDRLCAVLPSMEVRDITPMVHALRMVKTPAEVEKISRACAAAGKAFAGWEDWLRAEMPLREICRTFKMEALRHGADDIPYLAAGMGAHGYADVISPPDERQWNLGDVLMLDAGCLWDGYHCDFNRNIACQRAGDEVQHAHGRLWQATEVGMDAAVAGATCAQVFAAMHAALHADAPAAESGGASVGRYGHGVGIELTETPSITDWDDTPLQPNMVLALEPSLSVDGAHLLVHEENIVIQPDGAAALLTPRTPWQMPCTPR